MSAVDELLDLAGKLGATPYGHTFLLACNGGDLVPQWRLSLTRDGQLIAEANGHTPEQAATTLLAGFLEHLDFPA